MNRLYYGDTSAYNHCMAKSKVTSPKAAKASSQVLRDKRTGRKSKTAAGSALSQKPAKKKR